jgi:uncharacterized protein YdaU (DUF1376 family)
MHYYKFNIKDWTRDTAHLSVEEEGVYRRLLDYYYETEKPIPEETQSVIRRLRLVGHEQALAVILSEFFTLESDGYHQYNCDKLIAAYHAKAEANRTNGKKGGRPEKPKENPDGFELEPTNNLNHKPLTINQEEIKSSCDQQAESPKADRINYQSIAEAFGEHLAALPQPRDITEKRKKAIRSIVKRGGRYAEPDFFAKFFGYVAKSDFLMGRGAKPWHGCCFDWLLKPENFQKIIEGNYHGEGNNA